MTSIDIIGADLVINKINNLSKAIKVDIPQVVENVAQMGFEYSKEVVPVWSGETQQAIIKQPDVNGWMIISRKASHDDKPVNVYINEGNIIGLKWGDRTEPRHGKHFFFMKEAGFIMEEELNLQVNKLIVENV